MEFSVGAVLLVGSVVTLWLVRSRGGEVIPQLKKDAAQSTFMMAWLVVFSLGVAFIVEGLGN